MPELPEVETMRRGVAVVVGARIVAAEKIPCRRRPILVAPGGAAFAKRAAGRTIAEVNRVGKRVVLKLDSEDAIVIEPRMTGLVLLADPPTQEHLRFRIRFAGGRVSELMYWDRRGLGSVRLMSPRQIAAVLGPSKLGPDALELTANGLQSALASSRRAIKVALLDQRVVAGIGNLYAAEILHAAGIHPERRCDRLRGKDWQALTASMHAVLNEAIRYEGSTLGDGTYRNALNQAGGYQHHHRVYGRAGEECPTCGETEIVRIVQAQRSTFYCPACQPKGRR